MGVREPPLNPPTSARAARGLTYWSVRFSRLHYVLAWTLAQVSLRVTVRLKTGRAGVLSLSTLK